MRLFPPPRAGPIGPFHTPEGFHAAGSRASIAPAHRTDARRPGVRRARQCAPAVPASPWVSWALHPPRSDLAVTAREEILATYDRVNRVDIRPHESQPRVVIRYSRKRRCGGGCCRQGSGTIHVSPESG